MTTSYQKISGFDRPHVSELLSDSKISTLESGLKNFRICLRIRRMRVDDSRIRKEKVADSKISAYLWTGPEARQRRFPFDEKFRKFRVGERMEETFSGISFRNFGSTSRGWPKIPENRNNRKIPFHSTIPARALFLRAWKLKF